MFLENKIAMVNKVFLIGNLGKDPEIRRLDSGNVVARFPLATNENYKDRNGEWQKITEWHNIVLWGGLAERAEKFLHKGRTIFIEGKIRTRKWQDSNGQDRYTTEIIAQTFKFMDKKESNNESNNAVDAGQENKEASDIVNKTENEGTIDTDNPIDDLPF